MPNRQKLRKQRKAEQLEQRRFVRGKAQLASTALPMSERGNRLLHGTRSELEESVIQLLIGSASLRTEPEFRDLHFDVERAAQISARIFPKYAPRFERVMRKSGDERQQVYDDFRIEVIDELATPEFRQDLLKRLERCAARFQREGKQERWETTMLLRGVMEQPKLPWGICALLTTLFEETRAVMEVHDAEEQELLGDFTGRIKGATDPSHSLPLTIPPERTDEFARKVDAKPGLRERLERKAQSMIDGFERELFQGKYELHVFSDEEIQRAIQCFDNFAQSNVLDPKKPLTDGAAKGFAACIEQTVRALATPERIQDIVKALKQTGTEWLRRGKPAGALMQMESGWLADDPSPDNHILYTLFAGQLRRFSQAHKD